MAFKRKDEDVQVDQKNTGYATAGRTVTDADITRPDYNYQIGIPQVRYQAPTMPALQGFNYTPFSYGNYSEGQNVINARNALNAINGSRPGEWTGGQYGALLQAAVDKINNREPFKYDLNGDMLYQQYKNQFMNLGRMAMMDTIGQASAMTGGYGNSYANTAGNQAYQGYLQQLNDRVPELYQLAFDKYNQETADLYNEANLNNTLYNQEYGRYRDTVSDWENERNYLSNRYENERNFDYGQYSDSYNRALSAWNANTDAAYRAAQMANSNAMSEYERMVNDRDYNLKVQQLAQEVAQNKLTAYQSEQQARAILDTDPAKKFMMSMPTISEFKKRNAQGGIDGRRYDNLTQYIDAQLEKQYKEGKLTEGEVAALKGHYGIN